MQARRVGQKRTSGRILPTSAEAHVTPRDYTGSVQPTNDEPAGDAHSRRWVLGISLMIIVPLLQLIVEYATTSDRGRVLTKALVLGAGLAPLLWASSAGYRLATRSRSGAFLHVVLGVLAAGSFYAVLMSLARVISHSVPILRPQVVLGSSAAFRIGFIMGVSNYALWALAFILPFSAEDARVRALEADKLRTVAELAQLRSHLEPHFLLNTLSAVAGLVTENPKEARQMLVSLGDLLRDSLRSEGEMQTLGEQIDWLRRYAHILEVRHGSRVAFRWRVDDETRRAQLPRLLLQPLVENAVKHGALMRPGGGEISVSAEVHDDALVCTVEDNGPGVPSGDTRPGAFGLSSVRRRLALRYGERARLRLESSATGTRSIVELPTETHA